MNDEKFRENEWSSRTVRRVNVTAQLVSSLTARGPEPVKHGPSRSNVWVPLTSGGSKTPDTKTACAVVASAANAVATNARASTLRRVLSATSYSQKVKSAKAECGSRTTSNSHTNRVQLLELFDGFFPKITRPTPGCKNFRHHLAKLRPLGCVNKWRASSHTDRVDRPGGI